MKWKSKLMILIVVILSISILSIEIVLSLPINRTEIVGGFQISSSEYELLPGVYLAEWVK